MTGDDGTITIQGARQAMAKESGITLYRVYTEKEAVTILQLDRKTLERRRAKGRVPFVRHGKRISYIGAMLVDVKLFGDDAVHLWPKITAETIAPPVPVEE